MDTGKKISEAIILASTNPQYDIRLFMELQVQYMKIANAEYGKDMLCTLIVLTVKTKTIYVNIMFWTCNSMNNLMSYCGLVDAKSKSFWQRFTCTVSNM